MRAEEKHISVYSPVAIYSLPIIDRGGREYVGLLELLEPLGRVSSQSDGRHWRLRYNAFDADFTAGKLQGKIHGRDFDFTAPFLIENSRGLVPLTSLNALLPRFLGTPVNFRESARRLFIGDVGIQISFRLEAANPPHLILTFTAPVNPTISTEPGLLRMIFKRDPVVSPGSQSISLDDKVITHVSYSENNGDAELAVSASEPLLATFSSDRRTITISPIASATQAGTLANGATQPNPAQPPAAANQVASNANANPNANTIAHRILAVVDPAHGGDERGAALSETLAEKDVTLGFARLLRHELEIRGFAVTMLRDADTTLTLDQRATAANVARAGIYISLHATSQGNGARVYTSLLPVEAPSKGIFHAWNTAQAPVLPLSRIVSAATTTELQKKDFPAQSAAASLRPLNNVSMPALAVELAPGPNGLADLTSANYQQRAAAAIADAIASVRDRLGVQQ
ncbi:MAG TPA: N-acetylmuramoyl-L-alanine amidase [Terriglobales bacterium]|nr:N-acetylmuramoyl-L-alanine amidase [Terriglobales bacterium]